MDDEANRELLGVFFELEGIVVLSGNPATRRPLREVSALAWISAVSRIAHRTECLRLIPTYINQFSQIGLDL
ncbi:hypothetical protein [Pseudomonas sp. LT1P18]|uniref:hypothetical protein n=1 Tax=Pseudomonas arabinosi TaxID=3398357 RepID=UPI0039EFBAC1